MENRIRDLRRKRSLSQTLLGERVGLQKWDVSRLESGETPLRLDVAKKIADALDVDVTEVLGLDGTRGFSEDAVAYTAGRGDPFARLVAGPNQSLLTVKSNVLSELGILKSDVVLLDISEDAVKRLKPLQPVIVQLYDTAELAKATTLLRQFIPPHLLITNSKTENSPPLNMETEDAHIKGVILSWHRSLNAGALS